MMVAVPAIEQHPSPNHGPRPPGTDVDILLLHYTGMASGAGALSWLCDPRSQVSCHYFIFEDGRIVQLVDEARRAWHAGRGSWAGETDINSRSIGIELAHPGHEYGYRAFAGAQIAALIDLSHGILARNPIPPQRVLAHSDIAPERKEDPGELFPWDALHAAGIGHWVPAEPIVVGPVLEQGDRGEGVRDLQYRFRQYGYAIEEESEFGLGTKAVVVAFQRHFRPQRFDGIADVSTLATLDRLIATLPGGPAASA
ncbi:MAG: N-acetylmuramoyl-L-alanine amidase [Bauldia sp.]|nr:N-acetylmuramoyl-L-alanine amidase [Bauldia sp.]